MNETALGIDIGSHSVKAVLLRRRGSRFQVLRAGSALLEELGHMEDSRRKITKEAMIVRNLLRASGIRPQPAQVAVSGRKSIIRYTHVPPAPAWRLKMLIDYEIEGDTEGKAEDLAYDFRLLDLPTAHVEFTVIMAMARNELVERHCELLDEAGVRIDNVSLSPFPLFNTFVLNRGAAIEDDKTTLLVDIGSENLNVVVQRNGRLFFARNISPGGRAFTEAVQDEFRLPFADAEELKRARGRLLLGDEAHTTDDTQVSPGSDSPTEISGPGDDIPGFLDELGPELRAPGAGEGASGAAEIQTAQLSEAMLPVAGRLASAIQSSLMYCRAQTRMTDLEVDEMVLTGGGARLPGLRQALSRRLGIPVVPADPLKGLDLAPLKREAREQLENNAEEYATAIGLALSSLLPQAVTFNLLPKKAKQRRRFLDKTLYLWLAGAALLALTALLGFSSWRFTSERERHVNEAEAKLAADAQAQEHMASLLLVNREYAAEVAVMQDLFLSPRQTMETFGALTKYVPPEVELTKFSVGPAKSGAKITEILIDGCVLKRVKQPGGQERLLQMGDAHAIIGKLANDLTADPIFDPPPATDPVIVSEMLGPGANSVAEFQLRLLIAKVKHANPHE